MKTSSSESGQKIPLLVDSKTILKQPQQNFIFQHQQNLQQQISPSNIPQPQPPMPQQTFILPPSLYQQQQLQSSSPSAKSTSTPTQATTTILFTTPQAVFISPPT
jgi:hypothetical protein